MIFILLGIGIVIAGFIAHRLNSGNNGVSDQIKQYSDKKDSGTEAGEKKETTLFEDIANSRLRGVVEKIVAVIGDRLPLASWYNDKAKKADLPLKGSELLVMNIVFCVAVFLFSGFLMKLGFGRGCMLGGMAFIGITLYIGSLSEKRIKAFGDQLGDAIVMMQNGLRAGFTFQQAMDIVAKEMPNPISGEFRRALVEVQLGLPLEEALGNIVSRVHNDDFDLLVTAVLIQRQVGGNLAEILGTIGETIRERAKIKREIKTLTAEGVMTGWVLGLMPIFLAMALNFMRPGYFDGLLGSEYGRYIVAGSLISECIGGLIIKDMVNLKV